MTDQPQAPRYRLGFIEHATNNWFVFDDRFQDRVFPHRLGDREIVDLLNELETLRAKQNEASAQIECCTWKRNGGLGNGNIFEITFNTDAQSDAFANSLVAIGRTK